jgi:maltose-binding protein MalE
MIRIGRAGSAAAALVAMLMAALLSAMAASAAEQQKQPAADKKQHQLVLQVNVNDPAMMNLALNNATNVAQYYKDLGERATIEVGHVRSRPAYAAGRHLAGEGPDQDDRGE